MRWGRLRKRLNYANVMATVALFATLGGGAYAVTASKNSVTTKSVRNESLKGKDVAPDTLTGSDILEATLQGVTGPQGLKGDQGVQGPPGPTAAAVADRSDPVMAPDLPAYAGTATVTTPTPGRIYAMASGTLTLTCSAGIATAGLYVDGTPVPDSLTVLSGSQAATIFGITGTVAAAAHAITIGYDCPSGSPMAAAVENGKIGGIFLGS